MPTLSGSSEWVIEAAPSSADFTPSFTGGSSGYGTSSFSGFYPMFTFQQERTPMPSLKPATARKSQFSQWQRPFMRPASSREEGFVRNTRILKLQMVALHDLCRRQGSGTENVHSSSNIG
ncbi:hypothetical protein HPB49_002826 [Dermacentor silvarum]|uniref:Uncharacterized protein n=1 Tax=Dermacentor silvarum TaxID=543639 RepID=A0ACB8CNZ6_DERSI|nr:hypothetical protein HPB49_002826 [Dermacentor silvarum]